MINDKMILLCDSCGWGGPEIEAEKVASQPGIDVNERRCPQCKCEELIEVIPTY